MAELRCCCPEERCVERIARARAASYSPSPHAPVKPFLRDITHLSCPLALPSQQQLLLLLLLLLLMLLLLLLLLFVDVIVVVRRVVRLVLC